MHFKCKKINTLQIWPDPPQKKYKQDATDNI